MARQKPNKKMCPAQVACDGIMIDAAREMCSYCAEKIVKREKAKLPPTKSIAGRK